jgi:putative membrane protein
MNLYLLFKSLHLIAAISWIAGLLYLPRIFVYHVENKKKRKQQKYLKLWKEDCFFTLCDQP